MTKFTIKDFAEGRCAVKNDGTVEELNKVLKAAFPTDIESTGGWDFYMKKNLDDEWIGADFTELPIQSVKDFLEELEKPKLPKRGDRILVSIDGHYWEKSIFLTYIEGAKDPIICVAKDDEELFNHGDKFGIEVFSYCTSRRQDLLDKIIDMQKETNRLLDLRIGIDRKEGEA